MAKAKEEVKTDFNVDIREEKPGLYKEDSYYVELPLTDEKQDDVTVCINGTITKIQRGVRVKVSAAVYEVLQNSKNMDALAFQRRKALQSK
jgi:hypothetical protein